MNSFVIRPRNPTPPIHNKFYNSVYLLLNGTHQLLAYADDVNILGESVHTVKENAEALVVATKETGLEGNADKTKYMVVSGSECRAESQCED